MKLTNSPTFFVEAFQKNTTTIKAIAAAMVGRDASSLTPLEGVILAILEKDDVLKVEDTEEQEVVWA